ncbi:MAG TPA: tryptophan--tRNA ligase, partial [Buchnera sp. (in: enterobacteria)]|nr:tryptophan--tRNA ligase [Buchnera sp. (in: enterobacteria)]
DNSIIFIQSHVYEHCQLNWILNCYSYFGELTRMTQFKSKSKDDITNLNAGLFSYPILMASDVLLYQSDKVLVGLDQKQHLEFIIRIAKRFNNTVGEKIFTIPAILLSQYSSKIMSLLAPRKKMSKSDTNKNNTIFLLDSIHSIKKKISHAITDSDKPAKIYYDTKNKPGISNLLTIFSSITGKKISELEIDFSGYTYSKFKKELSEVLSIKISKLQKLYLEYRQDESLLEKIANEGAIKARHYAQCTIKNVYKYLNLMK